VKEFKIEIMNKEIEQLEAYYNELQDRIDYAFHDDYDTISWCVWEQYDVSEKISILKAENKK
jgi:hypothetical protein